VSALPYKRQIFLTGIGAAGINGGSRDFSDHPEGAISSYPPVFSANVKEASFWFSCLRVVLSFVVDPLLYPVYPKLEDIYQHLLVDSSGKFSERVQDVLLDPTIVIEWFCFDIFKKEEVTPARSGL
jgi:hypothetical protein